MARDSNCSRCGVVLQSSAYKVGPSETTASRCLRCTLLHWPMIRRSLIIGLVVGTLLTAINQGTYFVHGDLPASLAFQVPLTYLTPYCVATLGAVLNARGTVVEIDAP